MGGLEQIVGAGAGAAWELPAASKQVRYAFEEDDLLGTRALVCLGPRAVVLNGHTSYPPGIDLRCRVRLVPSDAHRNASFVLQLARDAADPRAAGVRLVLQARHAGSTVTLSVQMPYQRFSQRYNLKPYEVISPVLPESIRLPLERAMAEAAAVADTWLELRCRTGPDWVRVWVDDRLLVNTNEASMRRLRDEDRRKQLAEIEAVRDEKERAAKLEAFQAQVPEATVLPTSGRIRATLSPGARLGELHVRTADASSGPYEPIALDGYVRDRDLLGKPGTSVAPGALPVGGTVRVQGVPFQFADVRRTGGADHLDIGRSLLRQANMDGYHSSRQHRFAGAFTVDPARIQLRIPNGRYDALYVIAAHDGAKHSIPLLSASFYRPSAGFPRVFETTVPSFRARSADATRLPVRLENGRAANLWMIRMPLDPAALASLADLDTVEVELTKKVHQYRSYPDPYIYGWHQGGLPSGVHVYAVTLHRPDTHMTLEPDLFGHVWTEGQRVGYAVGVENRTDEARTVALAAITASHDGSETTQQSTTLTVPARRESRHRFVFAVKRHGVHGLRVTVKDGDREWTEQRTFALLAKDTRATRWEEGSGPLFGFWSYAGGHYSPAAHEQFRLMALAGARGYVHRPAVDADTQKRIFDKHNFQFGPSAWPVHPQHDWAGEAEPDPAKVEAFKKEAVERIRKMQGDSPDLVTFFPEPHISQRLTTGSLPSYWGEPVYTYDEQERRAIRVFFNTAKAAAEAVRDTWPDAKVLIPWGDPLFVVPLLREGFPKRLIDGSGLDIIGFERLPERQLHQQSLHRLYMLKEEYRRFGLPDPHLPYVEGIFVPTEPGACTWDEQAERYHRWTLISLAYGITHFYSGWFAFDCGDYYGAEHYGGCGIQRRIPYSDPKPAYAHFATMTRLLDRTVFERWLPTGSLTCYCLEFRRTTGETVYALWTVRGRRPVTLAVDGAAVVTVVDSMDNAVQVPARAGAVEVTVGTSPIYLTDAGRVTSARAGTPDHDDAPEWSRTRNRRTWVSGPVRPDEPVGKTLRLASLGGGTWRVCPEERDQLYQTNNYDTARYHAPMSGRGVTDPERPGTHLAVHFEPPAEERKLMPWYTVVRPAQPVTIPGRARQLGLWVKAHSDWGRIVYSLRDAGGERWLSTGTKDQWNCDDLHSWSAFSFDGWRYLHFELPSHTPYDSFREHGTTWWRSAGGDGIVDLPLKLEKIIVERRTHVLYVNDVQPADPGDVLLGELLAEYETAFDATKRAVAISRLRMELPEAPAALANPIRDMTEAHALQPTSLHRTTDPDWGYDGTRCHVHFDEAPGATQYQVWVSAHADGRGAVCMAKMAQSGELLRGLRPATRFYLWVTYTTAQEGEQGKPSNRLRIELVDAFGQK